MILRKTQAKTQATQHTQASQASQSQQTQAKNTSITGQNTGNTSPNTGITTQNTAITSDHKHHKHHNSYRNDITNHTLPAKITGITRKITSITITAVIRCDCDPGPLRCPLVVGAAPSYTIALCVVWLRAHCNLVLVSVSH